MDQAKRPITGLAGRYGHPVHPAAAAVPIGAWVASFIFDVASHVVSAPAALATGSRWLIGLGILAAVATALLGFLDLLGLPPGTRVFRIALLHLSVMLTVVAAYAAGFGLRGAEPAAPVPAGLLALSAVTLAALGTGGYLGGTLAYRYGVRVADEQTQATGYHSLEPPSHAKEKSSWE